MKKEKIKTAYNFGNNNSSIAIFRKHSTR